MALGPILNGPRLASKNKLYVNKCLLCSDELIEECLSYGLVILK